MNRAKGFFQPPKLRGQFHLLLWKQLPPAPRHKSWQFSHRHVVFFSYFKCYLPRHRQLFRPLAAIACLGSQSCSARSWVLGEQSFWLNNLRTSLRGPRALWPLSKYYWFGFDRCCNCGPKQLNGFSGATISSRVMMECQLFLLEGKFISAAWKFLIVCTYLSLEDSLLQNKCDPSIPQLWNSSLWVFKQVMMPCRQCEDRLVKLDRTLHHRAKEIERWGGVGKTFQWEKHNMSKVEVAEGEQNISKYWVWSHEGQISKYRQTSQAPALVLWTNPTLLNPFISPMRKHLQELKLSLCLPGTEQKETHG